MGKFVSCLVLLLLSGLAVQIRAAELVESAWFSANGNAEEWVALPDTWSIRGVPVSSKGHYTVEFNLQASPTQPQAVMLQRISTRRSVFLNGVLMEAEGIGPSESNPGHPVAALIDLPPNILRPGLNRLVIEVQHRVRGGLSPVEVGPKLELREKLDRHLLLTVRLPQAMNLIAAGVALVLLLLWLQRRSELAVGAFGAFALLTAVRSYTYYLDSAIGSAVLGDWLIFASQVWGVLFFFLFSQAYAQRWWLRVNRVACCMALVITLVGLWAIFADYASALRRYVYPVLLIVGIFGFALMARVTPFRSGWKRLLPTVSIGLLLAANAHDLTLLILGRQPVTAHYVTPFVLPIALMAVSLSLFERVVSALGRIEGLNRELEARVAKRTLDLESANLAKTRFIASASHDLRQPLASIGLLVGLARERTTVPAQRTLLEKASDALASLESLLSGLLDLSRLDGGVVQVRMQPVALQSIWSAIEPHESPTAMRKGVTLRFRPTRFSVRSDPVLLERVVRNLVANAVQYITTGSVLVAARPRGQQIFIEVRDSGPGIAQTDQATIFQEFARLPGSQDSQGLGLGLTIVQRTVELLGHELRLRSAIGRGSCFTVIVERAEPAQLEKQLTQQLAAPYPLNDRCCILVEDDAGMREALAVRLQAWGAGVHAFADLSALRHWLNQPHEDPDFAVCDFQLRSESGLQAISMIRERHAHHIPAVLITGDTAPEGLRALKLSQDPVLHKPFRSEALLDVIMGQLEVEGVRNP